MQQTTAPIERPDDASAPVWTQRLAHSQWHDRRMGTVVPDIDLAQLDDAGFALIGEALLRHSVVVLKNQSLPPEAQVAFTERFGPLEISIHREFTLGNHPPLLVLSNVVENGKPIGFANGGKQWHTDFSFMERCGLATVLYGVECPPEGANTMFADMYAAYDAFDDQTRARLDPMQVLHSYRLRYRDGGIASDKLTRCPDVVHPLVRTHPQTGRKALFLGCRQSAFAQGMPEAAGNSFMRVLIEFATQPQFVYSHKWEAGDVVIWDNRAVMHTATPFDERKYRRVMHRTSTIGERPV